MFPSPAAQQGHAAQQSDTTGCAESVTKAGTNRKSGSGLFVQRAGDVVAHVTQRLDPDIGDGLIGHGAAAH